VRRITGYLFREAVSISGLGRRRLDCGERHASRIELSGVRLVLGAGEYVDFVAPPYLLESDML